MFSYKWSYIYTVIIGVICFELYFHDKKKNKRNLLQLLKSSCNFFLSLDEPVTNMNKKKGNKMQSIEGIIQENKSKARKLIDETLRSGGVSFNHKLNKLVLNDGYTVSLYSIIETTDKKELEVALNRLKKINSFFGLWIDEGVFYLDVNINVTHKTLALGIGKLHHQLAIFDEVKKELVQV